LCLTLFTLALTACSDDEESKYADTPIVIDQIYLEDYRSSVPDRPVEFARLGQLIRLEGSGFMGLKKLYINGYNTYFNLTYLTDKSMLVNISLDTPVMDATDDVRDKIRLVKTGTELVYDFIIRASAPTATSISNTLPKAGETVTVYGTNLHETTKITLPGGTIIESGIVSDDEEGEWYSFTMPDGLTANGSIYSEGANGTAATPPYFNDSRCMLLDFDGTGVQGVWGWAANGSMINNAGPDYTGEDYTSPDLVNDPTGSGRGLCVPIVPARLFPAAAGKARVSECWTSGDEDWASFFGAIPATTPVNEVALQFDIYVPSVWIGSGQIEVCLFNSFNWDGIGGGDGQSTQQTAFYIPWIVDGKATAFQTEGWRTVTIPFSEFRKYGTLFEDAAANTPTFQMVVDDKSAATYKNFGIGFVNTDFTYDGFAVVAQAFNTEIYLDNWRIVPCEVIEITDYPEPEDE
jgi:hypothetical protein